jgi:hypothetical protein
MQLVHTKGEVQTVQFIGQTKHYPFDKYLPILQEEHDRLDEKEQLWQFLV